MIRRIAVAVLILLIVCLVPFSSVSAAPDYFTIVVMPDTQFYSLSYPTILNCQTQWIQDTSSSMNTQFVICLGDVTDGDTATEWTRAQSAYALITSVPKAMLAGNHDTATKLNTYFPYSSATSKLVSSYPTGKLDCGYYRFTFSAVNYGIMTFSDGYKSDATAKTWALAQLAAYPTDKVILATHDLIDVGQSMPTTYLWDNVIKTSSNIFMGVCGNYGSPKTERSWERTANDGHKVNLLLTDYQDPVGGGDGWIRYYRFYPARNTVEAYTLSPYKMSQGTHTYTLSFSFNMA